MNVFPSKCVLLTSPTCMYIRLPNSVTHVFFYYRTIINTLPFFADST